MMWTLSVLASALSGDLREAIGQGKACGASAVQLAVGRGAGSVRELTRSGQRDLLKALASSDLSLASLVTSCGREGFSPDGDPDRVVAHLTRAIEVAADLGRVVLCVEMGPLPPPPVLPEPPRKPVDRLLAGAIVLPEAPAAKPQPVAPTDPPDPRFESLLDAALIELGRTADRFGVRVAWRSSLGSLRSLDRALTAVACPIFGVDLDPVALLQETDAEAMVGRFAGRIWHVRARDALRGTGGRIQPTPVGKGSTDWQHLRALLDDASFAGPVSVDPTELTDRVAAAKAGLAVLRGVIGESRD